MKIGIRKEDKKSQKTENVGRWLFEFNSHQIQEGKNLPKFVLVMNLGKKLTLSFSLNHILNEL